MEPVLNVCLWVPAAGLCNSSRHGYEALLPLSWVKIPCSHSSWPILCSSAFGYRKEHSGAPGTKREIGAGIQRRAEGISEESGEQLLSYPREEGTGVQRRQEPTVTQLVRGREEVQIQIVSCPMLPIPLSFSEAPSLPGGALGTPILTGTLIN